MRPPGPQRPTLIERTGAHPAAIVLRRFALEVVEGADRGARATFDGRSLRVGTDGGCDLRLFDRFVSHVHAEVAVAADGFVLVDLGSRNGTSIDGRRIVRAYLVDGDVFDVGRSKVAFRLLDDAVRIPLAREDRFWGLVGQSVPMRRLFDALSRVSPTDATVLLLGETGTGKDEAARAIHAASPRARGRFEVVDCAGIPSTLLAAELFGHEKGAFTGAVRDRAGAFERASGGTVLLDEVGELSEDLQPQLLRVLERREVRRLGGEATIGVDVRILAATHRDLRADVNDGRFRADLYFRLSVVEIELPPLRDRLDDLPLLAAHLGEVLAAAGTPLAPPTAGEIAALARHYWPGNVRELKNVLERSALLGAEARPAADAPRPDPAEMDLSAPFHRAKAAIVERFERAYLAALLERTGGNVARAAREAKLNRAHLTRLLRRLRLGRRRR